jgi:hypothetical protein
MIMDMVKYPTRTQLMEAQKKNTHNSAAAHQKIFSLKAKFNCWKNNMQMKPLQGIKYWKKIGDKFKRTGRKLGRW